MSVRQRLVHIGGLPDGSIALAEAALTLAAWSEPKLDLGPYRRHLQALAHEARAYLGDDEPLAQLSAETARQIVSRRYGYSAMLVTGEPGEQSDGANLARVIDKRRGAPAALCILYFHVLSVLGVRVEVLDFLPRPMIRIQDRAGQRLVIDPQDDGCIIDARALRTLYRAHRGGDGDLDPFQLGTLHKRDLLVMLQDQIKVHHLRHAAPEAALAALEGALLVAPDNARLWREAGLLHARLEHVGDAIAALRQFLELPGGDAHRYTVSQLLQQLQNREDKSPT